jgi:hypothetical protein
VQRSGSHCGDPGAWTDFASALNEIRVLNDFRQRRIHTPRQSRHNGRDKGRKADMEAVVDDRTIRRIIALLVALAGLADRAAARSFPIRFLLLAILRRAERPVRGFVAEVTQHDWLHDEDPHFGNRPEDALTLAALLRAFAALLETVLPQGTAPERDDGVGTPSGIAHAPSDCLRTTRRPAPHRRPAPMRSGAGPPSRRPENPGTVY